MELPLRFGHVRSLWLWIGTTTATSSDSRRSLGRLLAQNASCSVVGLFSLPVGTLTHVFRVYVYLFYGCGYFYFLAFGNIIRWLMSFVLAPFLHFWFQRDWYSCRLMSTFKFQIINIIEPVKKKKVLQHFMSRRYSSFIHLFKHLAIIYSGLVLTRHDVQWIDLDLIFNFFLIHIWSDLDLAS